MSSIKTGNWEQTRNWAKSVNAKGGATELSDTKEAVASANTAAKNAGATDVVSLAKNESIGGDAVHRKMSAHDGATYSSKAAALEDSNKTNLASYANRNW